MKKKTVDILTLIPSNPKGISPGELILKLKLGTNKELKDFNKEIHFLISSQDIKRNKQGFLYINSQSKRIKKITTRKEKTYSSDFKKKDNFYKKSSPITKGYNKNTYTPTLSITDPREDFYRTCQEFKLPLKFSDSLSSSIETATHTLFNEGKRKTYMNETIFSIDGEDAKDLDDAISIRYENNIYYLNVYIADVSYFIKEGSPLDKEALKRGNSVYLINKVVPMLPETLSNDLCSLHPGSDKLVFVCEMQISTEGKILSYSFWEGLIRSKYRLNYTQVHNVLQDKAKDITDKNLVAHLKLAQNLSNILTKKRLNNQSLMFELEDTHIQCDNNDNPINFSKQERLSSHIIIENFMLSANECAASLLSKHKTGIFRVHAAPTNEKLNNFYTICKSIGILIRPFRNAKDIQNFLEQDREPYLNNLIHQLLVRSMSQAEYNFKNIGHFGLGLSLYTHFTSPIRRFSDIIVHRQIKGILKLDNTKQAFLPKYLSQVSKSLSKKERLAIDAERYIQKLKSIRFLQKYPTHIPIPGHVISILPRGIYIALDHTYIEGFVSEQSLNLSQYKYSESTLSYKSPKNEPIIIGSPILVTLKKTDWERIFIDFELVI